MPMFSDYVSLRKVNRSVGKNAEKEAEEDEEIDECDGQRQQSPPLPPPRQSKRLSLLNNLTHTLENWTANLAKQKTNIMLKHDKYYKDLEHEQRPRLVKKCGELNIDVESVPKRKRRLLSDLFNTILDIRWRWHIIIFVMTFLISWLFFASIWYLIALNHKDLEFNKPLMSSEEQKRLVNETLTNLIEMRSNLNRAQKTELCETNQNQLNFTELENSSRNLSLNLKKLKDMSGHVPCVHGIHDFTSALLYSVETQHTIGYGLRHITEECKHAIVFLMLQSCFGIFVQGLVAGVVFAKISRPNKRKRTIIFSHNAVVAERDGRLVFMFKIGNVRISQLSDAKLRMLMVKSRVTSDGEFIPFQTYNMKVGYDWSGNESIFFPWPKTVEHVIDESSPFYDICKHVII